MTQNNNKGKIKEFFKYETNFFIKNVETYSSLDLKNKIAYKGSNKNKTIKKIWEIKNKKLNKINNKKSLSNWVRNNNNNENINFFGISNVKKQKSKKFKEKNNKSSYLLIKNQNFKFNNKIINKKYSNKNFDIINNNHKTNYILKKNYEINNKNYNDFYTKNKYNNEFYIKNKKHENKDMSIQIKNYIYSNLSNENIFLEKKLNKIEKISTDRFLNNKEIDLSYFKIKNLNSTRKNRNLEITSCKDFFKFKENKFNKRQFKKHKTIMYRKNKNKNKNKTLINKKKKKIKSKNMNDYKKKWIVIIDRLIKMKDLNLFDDYIGYYKNFRSNFFEKIEKDLMSEHKKIYKNENKSIKYISNETNESWLSN